MARAAENVERRGRGRPARLSREAIVDAALALLEREPEQALTLSRLAEEVGAVPAALYRHVGSLDELLDGVLARVLEGIEFEIQGRASWTTQVRDWMICLRAQLLRYPAVMSLIGRRGRTSPAWFDAMSVLVEILERGGLRGAPLARASLWIAETTMGVIVTEATVPFREQISAARDALPKMSDEARRRHAPLIPHLEALDADAFFALAADRAIVALVDFAAGARRSRS